MSEVLAQHGHHPDPLIDAEVEIEWLSGLLSEAMGGLNRALMVNVVSPEGLAVKRDVRWALESIEKELKRQGRGLYESLGGKG